MRPRTLPVSIAGVVTAIGFAIYFNTFKIIPAILCLAFALLAQIVSNFANEYYDFKRGSDKKGRVGPRRAVTEGAISPKAMRNVTYATLAIDCIIGCCLIPYGGLWLIIVGVLIAIFALAYSAGPFPLSRNGLGDVAVLIFFGLVPVNLTFYLQNGDYNFIVLMASIAIGLTSVNVLLVNNYRDYEDDKEAGKNTTVVLFGRTFGSVAYLLNGYVAMALLLIPLWINSGNFFYIWHLPPVIYLILHTLTWNKLRTLKGSALNPVLGMTARNMLIFAILLFVCLVTLHQ